MMILGTNPVPVLSIAKAMCVIELVATIEVLYVERKMFHARKRKGGFMHGLLLSVGVY